MIRFEPRFDHTGTKPRLVFDQIDEPDPPEPPPITCIGCGEDAPAWVFNSFDGEPFATCDRCRRSRGSPGPGISWRDHDLINAIEKTATIMGKTR